MWVDWLPAIPEILPSLPPPPVLVLQACTITSGFFLGAINSGSYVCMANILPTEPIGLFLIKTRKIGITSSFCRQGHLWMAQ